VATVLTLLVDDGCAFGEAPSHTIDVGRIGCEVGGNGRGQADGCIRIRLHLATTYLAAITAQERTNE
jgi:hypothetical protein